MANLNISNGFYCYTAEFKHIRYTGVEAYLGAVNIPDAIEELFEDEFIITPGPDNITLIEINNYYNTILPDVTV